MPHVNSSGGEDLASTDEVKVYKDEGEEEKRSSENLSEDKLGLVTESEEDKNAQNDSGDAGGQTDVKPGDTGDSGGHIPGYVVTPLYPNGATVGSLGYFPVYPPHGSFPRSAAEFAGNKVLQSGHPGLAAAHMMMYNPNTESFSSPPPAHMGITPVSIDPKTGLPRPPVYPLPPHPTQYPHSLYSPDFSQWQGHSSYPVTTGAYRGPYPPIVTNSGALRFSHPGLIAPPHGMGPGIGHPSLGSGKVGQVEGMHLSQHELHRHEMDNCRLEPHERSPKMSKADKQQHIKKPLNAFMLFMKEQRAKVVAECTLKESAAINQILGRKWHALDRSEQAKYYDMAKKEKELHMQLYPGWSARDNYAQHSKRRKRKKPMEGENDANECTNPKKCRARFGVDRQTQWCKPCRRKKKCIRFLTEDDDDEDDNDKDDPGGGGSDTSQDLTHASKTTVTKADSTQNTAADLSSSPLSSPEILNPSLLSPLSISDNSPLLYVPCAPDSPDMMPSSTSAAKHVTS